ncbi:MAG: hypothetical protein LBJ60_02885 [Tannerellaceae bacterium]|nr:hypothetical protein [Tannerellaceae bacterium]
MARRKLTNSQVVCITLLWGFLCYLLLTCSPKIDFYVVFSLIASGVIVFVTIYKNIKNQKE